MSTTQLRLPIELTGGTQAILHHLRSEAQVSQLLSGEYGLVSEAGSLKLYQGTSTGVELVGTPRSDDQARAVVRWLEEEV